jgi:hypothetical protein
MYRLFIVLAGLWLSACSMQAMAEKRVPADVRAEVDAQIDRLIAKDVDFILAAFPEERNNPAFREQITRMVDNVPNGAVLRRDIVGVQGRTDQAYSDTQGAVRSGVYNLAHEIAFDGDAFLLVQTAHTFTDDGACCQLRAINASRHETSPYKAQLERQSRIMKFVALFTLISTLAVIVFLIIRVGGRKARAAQMERR